MGHGRKSFDFGTFEITKREILASISIIAVMILFGILISSKISERQMDKNEIYNKSAKIETQEMFQYGLDTNIGNAFVYGDLKAVDTVTYPEIGGEYMYVEKIEEHYNMHVEVYTTTNGKGVVQTHTRTYWSWDYAGSEEVQCKEVSFCGVTFDSNKIKLPDTGYIDTIKTSSHVRYKYYGVGTEYAGTIFTKLDNHTINETKFFNNMDIDKTVSHLQSSAGIVIFWVFWIILICGVVFGFYYLENEWLD